MYKLCLKAEDEKIVLATLTSYPHLWLIATNGSQACDKQVFTSNLIDLAGGINDDVFTTEISNFIGKLSAYNNQQVFIEGSDISKAPSRDELVKLIESFDYEHIIGDSEVKVEHIYQSDEQSNKQYFEQYTKQHRKQYSIFNSITNILIIINVVVFGLNYLFGYLPMQLIISGVHTNLLSELISVVLAGFSHASVMHIFFNMMFLHSIGRVVEQLVGKKRFIIIYFTGLLVSGYAVAYLGSLGTFTLGASGALFTLFGFFIVFVLKHSTNRKLKNDILINAAINLFLTISVASISIVGHISGLITGIAIYYIMSQLKK